MNEITEKHDDGMHAKRESKSRELTMATRIKSEIKRDEHGRSHRGFELTSASGASTA
jgi:hypothetical protein